MDKNMTYKIDSKAGYVGCVLMMDDEVDVCKCKVHVYKDTRAWSITSWFTRPEFAGRGYGYQTMQKTLSYCFDIYGAPASITYVWNGVNQYVLEWLEGHFDAVCTCPIAVQKTQPDDDWSSHIYELDKDKVFEYFKIQ